MCPIHETDSPEERWSKAEWEHYELWEKREARLRRKKRWALLGGLLVFVGLSAIPIVIDRSPQWLALKATRELAEQVGRMKRQAGERKQALRVSIDPSEPLLLKVEWGQDCKSGKFELDRMVRLLAEDPRRDRLVWLDPGRGRELGITGLLQEFCYDPYAGSSQTPQMESVAGFVIVPALGESLEPDSIGKDLPQTDKALTVDIERHAILLLRGPSAEISFE
jgi:hypothetical protein